MYKIGVIGERDSILGFKAVGLDVFPANSPSESESILNRLAESGYAVIFITEQAAEKIIPAIDSYSDRRFPAVILIPGNQGTLGIGMQEVRKSVERAIGADILFRDEDNR